MDMYSSVRTLGQTTCVDIQAEWLVIVVNKMKDVPDKGRLHLSVALLLLLIGVYLYDDGTLLNLFI